ncbi:replication factor RFC1 C terminal domain-containing protein [Glomus cerebriforme]|uniref:Replication factor C subunit 1 n=1 Tax=Glomus cerebriforme TaxID=658196 RepID=A0A397T9B9_9GLOM|nr:replication factor RFC1 C terminal domain-containing protein [Glomus cerebriforme]
MEIDDEIPPPQSTSENSEIFTTPKRSTRKATELTPKATTKKRPKSKIDDDDDFLPEEESQSSSPPKKTKREQKEVEYKSSKNRFIKTPRSKKQNVDDDSDTIITPIKVEENESPDIKVDQSYLNKISPTTPESKESKEISQSEGMCLVGKTFVFTGDLSMDREEAQDLVKRHGGRVTLQPSSKTSYVVVGQDPGPRKMEKVKQHKIPTLNEDQLLELIRTSPKKSDVVISESQKSKAPKPKAPITKISDAINSVTSPTNVSQLWTEKYRPKSLRDFCGNQNQVKDMEKWLSEWDRKGFKFKNKEWMAALLIAGSPGIGKTSAVHLIADLVGYKVVELNASDTRSKKKLETVIKVATKNTSITGFFQPESDKASNKGVADKVQKKKTFILMDEIDGMSAGDKGGIAELIQLIKKTRIPIICICNDINAQKLKSLRPYCQEVKFSKPRVEHVRSRIMTIATRENLQIQPTDVDELIRGANSDIRQILNLLSTWKINHESINYDEIKALNKTNEKHLKKNVFEIAKDLLSNDIWKSRKNTFNDKMKLYFQEHDLAPLMIFENYIKMKPLTIPKFVKEYDNGDISLDTLEKLASLEAFAKAADAMSYGDMVDKRIRGPQQEWNLMPIHGFLSTIAPAYYVHGYSKGGQFGQYKFPSWLGQNSKAIKIHRQLKEIQSHMRTKISADRSEVRESYIPTLRKALIRPLVDKKTEGVNDTIKIMDQYMITKEQFDAIMEFKDEQTRYKPTEIVSSLKSTFTKKYNSTSHPLPFLNISNVVTTKSSRPVITADVDDFIEEEVVPDDDDVIADDDEDLAKDRLIIQTSLVGRGGRGGRGGGRGGSRGGRGGRGGGRGGRNTRGGGRGRGSRK